MQKNRVRVTFGKCPNLIVFFRLDVFPKSFKFESGKLKKSWNHNVISLGLAYHFLEPLQATNIHLTLVQIEMLCQKCIRDTKDRTLNSNVISYYNKHIDNLIEDFKNFINILAH